MLDFLSSEKTTMIGCLLTLVLTAALLIITELGHQNIWLLILAACLGMIYGMIRIEFDV